MQDNCARLVALVLAFVSTCGIALAQDQPLPVEAFGRLPLVSSVELSPDGSRLAMAINNHGLSALRVHDFERRASVYGARMAEGDQLRSVGWAEDGRLSFLLSHTYRPSAVLPSYIRFRGAPRRVDYYRNGVVDLATQDVQMLSTNPDEPWADQSARLVAPIEGDPGFARLIGRAPGVEMTSDAIYRVNLQNGRVRLAPTNGVNSDTINFILDERGEPVARIDTNRQTNRWRVFAYDGERPRLLLEDVSPTGSPIRLAGLLADGRLAALDVDATGEFEVLYAIDRATGSREVLFAAEGVDVDGAIVDPWTRRVVGVGWTVREYEQRFFDATLESARVAVHEAFPSGSISLVSWSRDRRRVIAYGERGLDGGAYYSFTPADRQLLRISYRYPELEAADIGERQSLTYVARDGVRIPAYLTLPSRAEGAPPPPLVVLVHGGPAGRDTFDFNWWAAFLASRGYAVLQPNFRGSTGYGVRWERAGWGQWGGLMQTDVEDGLAALARQRFVDAGRVCIVGASYGGYAALAGATLTPNLYRCAVSIAGVSDLNAMLVQEAAETRRDSITSDYWRLSIGDRQEDRERIRAVSPVNLTAQARAPILLIHGTDDTVVPIDQSRRMQQALRTAGKDVRFVELQGDDHWLSDAPTRIQMLRELEAFLALHLGASAVAQ
ncbi:MAG TPA: hypothetical protein DHW63_06910 [Hyphomonadaceae bacterium]|nr:hypothetical protein [Hyphomonadaceae bacterium]